jgi:RsiW-degrading membrane proteinase PrsW (M82 family)
MQSPYQKFALIISINAVIMFFITYVMIDSIDHFYFNINRVYMALLMVAPMVVLMLFVMRSMYKNKKVNLILYAAFIGLFILIFSLTRTQTPVGNEQFLRSMIPHHSSAILMCQESSITDPEIMSLCDEIVQTQREEITEMEEILRRY